METCSGFVVPDFGPVIARQHIVRVFRAQRPSLTLICAPAGYGKSVLAAQVAHFGEFDTAVWVSAFDEDMTGDKLLAAVHAALVPLAESLGQDASGFYASLQREDILLAISDVLESMRDTRLCLVMDGCNALSGAGVLLELAALTRVLTAESSSVVVTCRRLLGDDLLDPTRVLCVENQDLRFTQDDILQLQSLIGTESGDDEAVTHLSARFGGHPALTALMLRHGRLDVELAPPRDLLWYLDRLVAGLSHEAIQAAYLMSLLVEGETGALPGHACEINIKETMHELLSLSPVLVMGQEHHGSRRFRMHAALRVAVRRRAESDLDSQLVHELRTAAMLQLEQSRGYVRMQAILQGECSTEEISAWCERCGDMMLRVTGAEAMMRLLGQASPSAISASPKLLLLRAMALRDQERLEDAQNSAALATGLAESLGNDAVWVTGMLLVARLALDVSDFTLARSSLVSLESSLAKVRCANAERTLRAYLAVVEMHQGQIREALLHADRVTQDMDSIRDMGSAEAALAVNCLAGVEALGAGRWSIAARHLTLLASRRDVSAVNRVTAKANLAACHVELGNEAEAVCILNEVIEQTEAAELWQLAACAYGTRAAARFALGDSVGGMSDHLMSESLLDGAHQERLLLGELITSAVTRRAIGRHEDALSQCEKAKLLGDVLSPSVALYEVMVSLETAASHLSLSDIWSARKAAQEVRASLAGSGAMGHLLRADLILAEADRLEGDSTAAILRLSEHADYIATGSANWLIAMYARAFPGLLGMLTQAIGAEALPLRMLLMVPLQTLTTALELAPYLTEDERRILLRRRGAEAEEPEHEAPAPSASVVEYSCYARLFGGLEVTTKAGVVNEDDWRKRKARLLFLALLLKQHQDVPRDVILERLWPDMDEEHAKRNFYVTWSTMKRALACGGVPADAKSFVQCSGGVCRATRQVRSDLDDFDETLSVMRSAEAASDSDAVLAAARRLVDLYRGELLPGDLYEEWFAEARERTKHDFCDAMMAAASAAESRRESETALLFLRKASSADPWREDVYQSMMRCQMNAGQRSRAIETYLSCRSRLTEDLGIDPSVETTRIYQAVLAMEAAQGSES